MKAPLDLCGKVFGRLTVLHKVDTTGRTRWKCACSCGVEKNVAQQELMQGDSTSCGCVRKEQVAARNSTHGGAGTYTWGKWRGMLRRIKDTDKDRNKCYKGVTVQEEWKDYSNFLADLGECPQGYSLERKDNNKGYSKDNCKWVPLAEQAANTSRNVKTLHKGELLHISEIARREGLPANIISDRINKLGWDVQTAISTPRKKQKALSVETLRTIQIMREKGASQYTIAKEIGITQGGVSAILKRLRIRDGA